jgi:hypothetical protein
MGQETGFCATTDDDGNNRLLICDSGATLHMTGDMRLLDTIVQIAPMNVVLTDGRAILSTKAGSMQLQGVHSQNVPIDNVLYVPGLRDGLFSVGRGCETIADE